MRVRVCVRTYVGKGIVVEWVETHAHRFIPHSHTYTHAYALTYPILNTHALDCSSGFQSIPLLALGYAVTGVDMSRDLLDELERFKGA